MPKKVPRKSHWNLDEKDDSYALYKNVYKNWSRQDSSDVIFGLVLLKIETLVGRHLSG